MQLSHYLLMFLMWLRIHWYISIHKLSNIHYLGVVSIYVLLAELETVTKKCFACNK